MTSRTGMPCILGLTGSIGMGKSSTAAMFARLGAAVFDADAAVHALLAPGGAAVAAVAAAFPDVADPQGGIDRRRLGARVFADPAALRRLEDILHPAVAAARQRFLRRCARRRLRLAVLDIPLLFEAGLDRDCDATAVVVAPPAVQKGRVLARPGMTPEKFRRIRARQMPDRLKMARADMVILTGLDKRFALRQVRRAAALLMAGSASGRAVKAGDKRAWKRKGNPRA